MFPWRAGAEGGWEVKRGGSEQDPEGLGLSRLYFTLCAWEANRGFWAEGISVDLGKKISVLMKHRVEVDRLRGSRGAGNQDTRRKAR